MGSYYQDIYLKRLNRYGNNYQERVQNQREDLFEQLLLKSLNRVDFLYNSNLISGILERYKQDDTETLGYLLTPVDVKMPAGTLVQLPSNPSDTTTLCYWMIFYLEQIKSTGYNRYIVLKMNYTIEWTGRDKVKYNSPSFIRGTGSDAITDRIVDMKNSLFPKQDQNLYTIIMPVNQHLQKDVYIPITSNGFSLGYNVVGIDIISTPGVMYVSLDPVGTRIEETSSETGSGFWFGGDN